MTRIRALVRRYGWRVYAIPVLLVLSVVTIDQNFSAHSARSAHRAGGGSPSRGHGATVEGLTGDAARYRAGLTPAPIVVDLGTDVSSCGQNPYPTLLLVSISQQRLWACEGARQVDTTAVTTGRLTDSMQTPLGSWRVQGKQRDRYLVGPGYRDYVHYWVPFNGDFGLHDAPWQTMPFGSAGWRTQGSHGCVHVPTPTMDWIYQWVHVGDTVVTIES